MKWVAVPNRNTGAWSASKSSRRRRWFKKAQRWRTGCEGRISVLKRRHGLGRCRYRGLEGMKRWVGLGVLADNLINIGNVLAAGECLSAALGARSARTGDAGQGPQCPSNMLRNLDGMPALDQNRLFCDGK